jgi:thymidine kinase
MSKLIFYYGTMRSSKSAQLIMTAYNYQQQNKPFIIFKPSVDTRDGNIVKSRALSTTYPVYTFDENDRGYIYNMVKVRKYHAVLIDEIQFAKEHHIDELARIADELDVPVLCFGLLTDFQGKLFEGSKCLVELADKIQEIKTVCWYCDRKARFNMRTVDGEPVFEGEQIQIGDEEYLPVCRKCYMNFKNNTKKQ